MSPICKLFNSYMGVYFLCARRIFCDFFIVGRNNFELSFSQPFPAYIYTLSGCCWSKYGITIAMWLKLKVLPANLVRLYMPEKTNPDLALKISSNRNITFSLKGESIRLAPCNINNHTFWVSKYSCWIS